MVSGSLFHLPLVCLGGKVKCKDLVVCYGIFKNTVSDRVGDGSWMSRKRDGWTEETLLGQENRQKAKRG